ncbi:MAG: AAA family ATPase, partial [Deltaproteobacteria bacterium]|nr:AAA family ATPase [Deltaproteobacteria bacterium]
MKEGRRGVQHSLFPTAPALEPPPRSAPMADRMRPRTLEAFAGQAHLLAPGKAFRRALETDTLGSVILWGPPGSGKTTLAYLVATLTRSHFVAFSAVLSGVKEIREVIGEARERLRHEGRRTILFVDEIHRFNRSQQDAFLPHVERGTIILIGATTENPSFEVNSPLLSRCQVVVLQPLGHEELLVVLQRALTDSEQGLGAEGIEADPAALRFMAESAQGDARRALNVLERAALLATPEDSGRRLITLAMAEEALQQKSLPYDKAGEEHYNIISA